MDPLQASGNVERIRLLSEAARDLLAADEPDDMLQRLFVRARKTLPIDVYFNFMVDPGGEALHLASSGGVSASVAGALRRIEFGQAVCGTVAARGEPLYPSHIQDSDDPLTSLVRGLGIRAYACNPLRVGDRVLGTLSFGSRTSDRFGEEDLELFRAICRCVTFAYQRLQAEEALRGREEDLRRSGEKLAEQLERLAEQDRRKEEFLGVLGHELRNPLAALQTGIEVLLREERDPGASAEVVRRMANQARQLGRLIDDLLDVTRISRGKVTVRKRVCALRDVVERAVDTVRSRLDGRSQELVLALPSDLHVEADPERLEQVVGNLLDNASQHSPEGGCIEVRADAEAPWVTVRVLDSGDGVPEEMHERIFEAFVQERGTTSGLGLGLALVRQLVTLQGGEVWLANRMDGGAEFAFRIPGPCPAPADAAGPRVTGAEGSPRPAGMAERAEGGAGPRVLIVDDHHDALHSLAALLRLHGCEVRTCSQGAEARRLALAQRPDAILLDLALPDLDGFAVARSLREESALRGVQIFALTGYGDPETVRRVEQGGFDDLLLKPTDAAALMARITERRPPADVECQPPDEGVGPT